MQNRTPLDECSRVKDRENWYLSIAEIQRDLAVFMSYYNLERSHQGYRLNGRTPAQALREALGIETLPELRFESALAPTAETTGQSIPSTDKEVNLTTESA